MACRLFYAFLVVVITIPLHSCDSGLQGEMHDNLPPKTFLSINDINLEIENDETGRLVSQVHIFWWGDDPDGFVKGYEFTITDKEWSYSPETEAEVTWHYTEQTDSVFVLPIPPGETTADVRFTIRAIDNEGLKDPEGASVVFPIINSPPKISLHRISTPQHAMEVPPDTTYHIASFGWTASDPDGEENLSHFEISLNDTTLHGWLQIPVEVGFLTLRATEPGGMFSSAEIYLGRSFVKSDMTIEGLRMNSKNTFFIRAIDKADAVSPVDSLSWYIKEQRSRVLFVHDYPGLEGDAAFMFHIEILRELGIEHFDLLDVRDGTTAGAKVPPSAAFHQPFQPTLNRVLAEWDHIYWISGNIDRNITYALRSTIDFFEEGGTMFVNIPAKRIPDDDVILDFLPLDRVASLPPLAGSFRMPRGAELTPILNPSLPVITVDRTSLDIYPLVPPGGYLTYYNGGFQTRPFDDPDADYSRAIVTGNPEKSLIYFGYNLHWLTSGPELNESMRYLLRELNFPVDNE